MKSVSHDDMPFFYGSMEAPMKQRFFDRIDRIRQTYGRNAETTRLTERIRDWQKYDSWEKIQIEQELSRLESRYKVKNAFRF